MPDRPAAQQRKPRLVDVATRAGVSAQTVSNVLNARKGFTEETRQRVLTAMDELGFRPNRAAQSLRAQRTRQIGFDMSAEQLDVRNPFHLTFLRALVLSASRLDHRVVVYTHQDTEPDSFGESVAARDVDGFVLSNSDVDDSRAHVLAEHHVPFVTMGRIPPDLPQRCVDIDNRAAMELVVDHLVQRGHTRFAYLGHDVDAFWIVDRLVGTRARLAQHGIELPDAAIRVTDTDDTSTAVRELLDLTPRPTAIIADNDSRAIVAVTTATSMGLQVGADLAVTGFDGGLLQQILAPTLTTVRIPVEEIADRLVTMLVDAIEGGDGEPDGAPATLSGGVIMDAELVVGATS